MSRLLSYLTTQVPPSDIEYYAEHDVDICPLCLNPHHGYTKHIFKVAEDGEVFPVAAYICAECQYEIEDAEIFEENKYWEHKIPATLRTYMDTGKFPENAQAFTGLPQFCMFCRNDIDDDYMELALPIGDNLVGGTVHVCGECATVMSYNRKYEALDICRICGEHYPITASEHRLRRDYGTLEKCLCRQCAVSEHGPIYPEQRWKNSACEICTTSVVMDLMQLRKEQLETPRCPAHMQYVPATPPPKYNLYICYDKPNPLFRAVITDRKDYTIVTYEKTEAIGAPFYKVLNSEIILPNTVTPENILWSTKTKLKAIIDEDRRKTHKQTS